MVSITRSRGRTGSILAVLGTAVIVAGCGSASNSSSSSAPSSTAAAAAAPTGSAVAISTTKGSVGTYLTGASGRPLYMWVADTGGRSNCAGQCAKFWPPLLTKSTPTVSGGASAKDLGTITRTDGSKQVTYKGHPLYYFLEDSSAGSLHGQGNNGFGAKWWVVSPTGTVITKTVSATPAASSSSSSAGGGGSGY